MLEKTDPSDADRRDADRGEANGDDHWHRNVDGGSDLGSGVWVGAEAQRQRGGGLLRQRLARVTSPDLPEAAGDGVAAVDPQGGAAHLRGHGRSGASSNAAAPTISSDPAIIFKPPQRRLLVVSASLIECPDRIAASCAGDSTTERPSSTMSSTADPCTSGAPQQHPQDGRQVLRPHLRLVRRDEASLYSAYESVTIALMICRAAVRA